MLSLIGKESQVEDMYVLISTSGSKNIAEWKRHLFTNRLKSRTVFHFYNFQKQSKMILKLRANTINEYHKGSQYKLLEI